MGIDVDGLPMDEKTLNRFWRVTWLIFHERVPITTKFDDLHDEAKRDLFDNIVKEYLEYPGNMSKYQTITTANVAMKVITEFH